MVCSCARLTRPCRRRAVEVRAKSRVTLAWYVVSDATRVKSVWYVCGASAHLTSHSSATVARMRLHASSVAAAPDGFAATAAASSGGDVETGFWLKWPRSEGRRPSQYPNHADFLERTAENAALPDYLCDRCARLHRRADRPRRARARSSLGTHCGGVRVELFPIDVLAPSYDGVLDQGKLTPRTRTRFCPVEQIGRRSSAASRRRGLTWRPPSTHSTTHRTRSAA